VRVQGRGVVDIPTHLVDRSQWLVDGAPRLVSARSWPTRVPQEVFRRITGESDFPSALEPCVEGDALIYACNADLVYRIGDVVTQASARWELTPPRGGGDTSRLVARGRRADVRLEQSAATGHRRALIVDAFEDRAERAVTPVVSAAQPEFPGLRAERRGARSYELLIPAGLDGGHEAHFALVLDAFLRAIDEHRWPADVAARTLAKYALLAEAGAAT